METFLRTLREGRTVSDQIAPLVLVRDSLDALGGPHLFTQCVSSFCKLLLQGRTQAQHVALLTSVAPASPFARLAAELAGVQAHATVINDNPMIRPTSLNQTPHTPHSVVEDLSAAVDSLRNCANSTGSGPSTLVVLDDLDHLIECHGFDQVVQFLQKLCDSPEVSCVLSHVHQDTLSEHELATLSWFAFSTASLAPLDGLTRDAALAQTGMVPQGQVQFSFRRRASGRQRTETALYSLRCPSTLVFLPPLQATTAPKGPPLQLEKLSESTTSTLKISSQDQAGGMRLELSEKEKAAKQQVVLPYQHQGQSSVYQGDFKEYLPVAAGGTGQLGHVMYVRDSDEEHDSDEDPDDDLDI